ncbi:DUF6518 family protein [Allosalinactinospora lopnorensis]|uniref:DUF6518 family protein n=1 Tax=Allosalinactinospora lopnorensis TaxID=1352348 RepID=UPI000623EBFC|nr:DUF6518 family protein [Allosalinactinospora lopnorensis]
MNTRENEVAVENNLKSAVSHCVIISSIGVAAGALTSYGQTYLPEPFTQLANSYSVWLTFSFVYGLLAPSKRFAVPGGIVVQMLAIAGYYLVSELRFDAGTGGLETNLVWLFGGLLVGPAAGLAGYWARTKRELGPYALGVATCAIAIVREPMHWPRVAATATILGGVVFAGYSVVLPAVFG